MENNNTTNVTPNNNKRRKIVLFSCLGVAIIFILLIIFVFTQPKVVRFVCTHGSTKIDDIAVDKEGHIKAPNDPQLTGWDFLGWSTNDSLDNIIDLETYVFDSKATLYAQWRLHRYVINYVTDGGTLPKNNSNYPMEYYCIKCNTLLEIDNLKETKKCPSCNHKIDLTDPEEENYTYVKKYVYVIKHQIPDHTWEYAFDYQNNIPTFNEQRGNLGVSLATPTKEGYTFLGWYTEEENGVQITSLNSSYKNYLNNPEDITLYARWE